MTAPKKIYWINSIQPEGFVLTFLEELQKQFHVEYISSHHYGKRISNFNIINSIYSKWKMYISIIWRIYRKCRTRPDYAIVTTNPFFSTYIVRVVCRKPVKVINLVWDIYPDVLEAAGFIRKDSIVSKVLARVTKATFESSDANIFIGSKMLDSARSRYKTIAHPYVIPVGCNGAPFRDTPPLPIGPEEKVGCIYCGNIGHLHDVETIITATNSLSSREKAAIKYLFQTHSMKVREVKEGLKNSGVEIHFGTKLPEEEWHAAMLASHISFVTLIKGAESVAVPSKIYSSMAAGQAIFAVCSPKSDLADIVESNDCGWVVEPGDTLSFRKIISIITSDRSQVHRKRLNAYRAGNDRYDIRSLMPSWTQVLRSLKE